MLSYVTYSFVFYCVLSCFIVFLSLYFTYWCIYLFNCTAARMSNKRAYLLTGSAIGQRKGYFWGSEFGARHCNHCTAYVWDSAATRPSSQITLGRRVIIITNIAFLYGPDACKTDVTPAIFLRNFVARVCNKVAR